MSIVRTFRLQNAVRVVKSQLPVLSGSHVLDMVATPIDVFIAAQIVARKKENYMKLQHLRVDGAHCEVGEFIVLFLFLKRLAEMHRFMQQLKPTYEQRSLLCCSSSFVNMDFSSHTC